MKKIINSILIYIFLQISFSFEITPYYKFQYNSDSNLYAYSDLRLTYHAFGVNLTHTNENLNFHSNFSYHLFEGINERPNDFNSTQGFGYLENNPGLSSKQFNYFFTSLKLNYNKDDVNFYIGLDNPLWGVGENRIVLSDKVPPFFNFGYQWKITDKLSYEHLFGKLNSLIKDSSYLDLYENDPTRYSELPRNISAHKVDYALSDMIDLGLFEIIVYGGNRDIEPYYLLPFVPFLPIQTYLGDLDNDLIGAYFNIQLKNHFNLYSTLMIDEWTPPDTFKKKHKNWFIYNIGIEKKNFLFNKSNLIVEYSWSDNRVYQHKFPVNDYYSYDYPLGFWAGPHSENLFLKYNFSLYEFEISIEFSSTKRGEGIIGYNDNFINRYSGITEKKQRYTLDFQYNVNRSFLLNVGYNYINWINAGFDPFSDGQENLINLLKNDIYLNINYTFKEYNL